MYMLRLASFCHRCKEKKTRVKTVKKNSGKKKVFGSLHIDGKHIDLLLVLKVYKNYVLVIIKKK